MRIKDHPILGPEKRERWVKIKVDGIQIKAIEGESIATALHAAGWQNISYSLKYEKPRGIFCAVGRCTDCAMVVDGVPGVRTCVTPVRDGMEINTFYDPSNRGNKRK